MKTRFERMSDTAAAVSDDGRGFAWRVAMAIYREYENRPLYAQGQMNGVLAAELAVAAIRAMRDPDARMVAAALPLIEHPTDAQRTIGKAALALLPPVRIEQHFQSEQAAADLVRDWQTMIDAVLAEGLAAASADTLPKGQDAQQGLAGTESGAVPKADAQPHFRDGSGNATSGNPLPVKQ